MRPQVAPKLPWRPEATRLALRGRVLLRLRDEAPESVPAARDVELGAAAAARGLEVGRLQATLRRFSPELRVTRVFHAAKNLAAPGRRHLGFDDQEHEIGLSRTLRVEVEPRASITDLVQSLRELDRVEMASACYLAQTPFAAARGVPAGPARDARAAFERIGAERARSMQRGDPTVIVAVIDSGVALGHAELLGRLRPGYDAVDLPSDQLSRNVRLLGDAVGRDRRPMDEAPGHGTACAGLIAARGLNVEPGLAAGCPLLPVRALAGAWMLGQAEPTAVGGLPDIDVALKWAVDAGARVLNLSFGTPRAALREDDPVPHAEVVRYALARGCILVAAAGNDGSEEPYFPAALPGVIAVGAVDADGAPSSFTSRGPHVALSAPGERLPCVALRGYQQNTGTSFAAPLVAGACALLVARGAAASTPVSPARARELLVRSANPFAAAAAGCGAGVLDVPAALRAFDDGLAEEDEHELAATAAAGADR